MPDYLVGFGLLLLGVILLFLRRVLLFMFAYAAWTAGVLPGQR
jgi:hypothetical protein